MKTCLIFSALFLVLSSCDPGQDADPPGGTPNDVSRAADLVLQAREEGRPSLVLVRRGGGGLADAFPALNETLKGEVSCIAIDADDPREIRFMTAYGEAQGSRSVLLAISSGGNVLWAYTRDPGIEELRQVFASRRLPEMIGAMNKPGMALVLYGKVETPDFKKADETVRKVFASGGNGPVVFRVDSSDENEKVIAKVLDVTPDAGPVVAFALVAGKDPVRIRGELTAKSLSAPFASCASDCGPSG